MSVVISEVEHRPMAGDAGEGTSESGAAQPAAVRIDGEQILAVVRRQSSRRARLWAD